MSIAKELNLNLVAEGVERMDQVEELYRLGCRTIQGYITAKPMRESELLLFVEDLVAKEMILPP